MKISPETPTIDVKSALNLIGKDFRFDHAKGISEWLKNSVDAYNQEHIADENQNIIVFLRHNNDYITEISVLDFVGMSQNKIDKAFKVWFSPEASKIGNTQILSNLKTYGGHGNGGKFYMRQMFKESRVITYHDGKINIFGFNTNNDYGYVSDYVDRKISPNEALEIAGLTKYSLPDNWIEGVLDRRTGFTLMQGMSPKKAAGTNYKMQLAEKLVKNPQARRLIDRKNIYLQILNDNNRIKLSTPTVKPIPEFMGEYEYIAPVVYAYEGKNINFTNKVYSRPPRLTLKTSIELLRGANYGGLNSIDFLGEIGVIANYQVHEMSNISSSFSEFIYGECESPIMEDINHDLVRNDREKFINSERTFALLDWVSTCIKELAGQLEKNHREDKRQKDLSKSSVYNQILNTWKNNFLKKMLREQLFGNNPDIPGIGGSEDSGPILGTNPGSNKKDKGKKKTGSEGGNQSKKKDGHPSVLISDYDPDPFSDDGTTFSCDPRHPAVYQRRVDVLGGIYWINSSKSLAKKILSRFHSESAEWRSYLFQRYVDIIVKEAIYQMGKKQLEMNAISINDQIDEIISNVHDKASEDLQEFLFEKKYEL